MKIASRYLLPVELLTSLFLVSWGLLGSVGGGVLWRTLQADGLNEEWGLVLCGVGGAQFLVAALEGYYGRRWPDCKLFFSVTARYCLAFLAGVCWIWLAYMLITLHRPALLMLAIPAPACLAACFWIFFGNRKVACLLDPTVPTSRLEREILEERADLARTH